MGMGILGHYHFLGLEAGLHLQQILFRNEMCCFFVMFVLHLVISSWR